MTATHAPVYELWDTRTGNLLGDYLGEDAALLDIREGVREDGADLWSTVALVRVEEGGTRVPVAEGGDLLTRAEAAAQLATPAPGGMVEATAETAQNRGRLTS